MLLHNNSDKSLNKGIREKMYETVIGEDIEIPNAIHTALKNINVEI